MNQDSEVPPSSRSTSNSRQSTKVRKTLRWSGFAALCLIQLTLGGISTVVLLLAVVNKTERDGLGVQFSIFLALCGLICLILSIYNSFRYGKLAGKFTLPDSILSQSTSKKIIKTVILSSLIGVCLAFLGSIAIAIVMFHKVLFVFEPGILFPNDQNIEFVSFLDVSISQACIGIMAAHCAGVVNSLWTLSQIEKQSSKNQQSMINY